MTLFWNQIKLNIVTNALSRAPVWPAPDGKDILACKAHVAAARETKVDEAILALSAQAEENEEYKAIYNALKARKDPKLGDIVESPLYII